MITITILMPTFNRAVDLGETLAHFTRLVPGPYRYQLVVIDNNSTDRTRAVVESYAAQLPVRYLFQPVPGKNRALNLALDTVELGHLVLFTDDDITPDPRWLCEVAAAEARWPGEIAFGGRIDVVYPTPPPVWAEDALIQAFAFAVHHPLEQEGAYPERKVPFGPNYWVRAAVFQEGRRFDESIGPQPRNRIMGDETLFLRSFLDDGQRIIYVPSARVGHRIQAEMLTPAGILRRARQFGRTAAHLRGVPQRALLSQGRWRWFLARWLTYVWAALELLLCATLSRPARRIPRIVRRLIRMGYELESMRLVRTGRQDERGAAVTVSTRSASHQRPAPHPSEIR